MFKKYISWWLDDFPQMDGMLRCIFYAGLFCLMVFDRPTPFDAPSLASSVPPLFNTPTGLMQFFEIGRIDPDSLRVIRILLVGTWAMAFLGFCIPITSALTAIGFAVLHGSNAGILGSNHSCHLALYSLFALCFCVSDDKWTADYHIRKKWAHWMAIDRNSLLRTGFARKLVLIFAVYCLFSAGVSKMLNGGLGWLDGSSLHFYISESAPAARIKWLSEFVLKHSLICALLASITIVFELGSILALVSRTFRIWVFSIAILFHLGISAIMMPSYWIHMWCYILIFDWRRINFEAKKLLKTRFGALKFSMPEAGEEVSDCRKSLRTGATAGTKFAAIAASALCAFLLGISVAQVEFWPFTAVKMYSNYIGRGGVDLPEAGEIDKLISTKGSSWRVAWTVGEIWETVDIVADDGSAPQSLYFTLYKYDKSGLRWTQYQKVVRSVVIADLLARAGANAKSLGSGGVSPGPEFLKELARYVDATIPSSAGFKRIELVCLLRSGRVVLASEEL